VEVFWNTSTDVWYRNKCRIKHSFPSTVTDKVKSEYKCSQQIVSKCGKIGMGTTAMCKNNLKEEFRWDEAQEMSAGIHTAVC
jgi:hypothetical protein